MVGGVDGVILVMMNSDVRCGDAWLERFGVLAAESVGVRAPFSRAAAAVDAPETARWFWVDREGETDLADRREDMEPFRVLDAVVPTDCRQLMMRSEGA